MITTYDVVASEWVAPPKVKRGAKATEAPAESDSEGGSDDSLLKEIKNKGKPDRAKPKKKKTLGPLFEAAFYRIILGLC